MPCVQGIRNLHKKVVARLLRVSWGLLWRMDVFNIAYNVSRWWQLKDVLFFTPKVGEDEPILTDIFFNWVGEKPPTTVGLQRQTDAPNLMELWKQQDELILFDETEVVSLSTRLATTWSVPQWMAENWLCQFGTVEAWCVFLSGIILPFFLFSLNIILPKQKKTKTTMFKMSDLFGLLSWLFQEPVLFEVMFLKLELLPSLLWSSSTLKRTFVQSPNTFIFEN